MGFRSSPWEGVFMGRVIGGPKGSQPWTTGETLVRNRADRQGVSGDPLVRLFLAAAR